MARLVERQVDPVRHDYLGFPGIAAFVGVAKIGIRIRGAEGFSGKRLFLLSHDPLLVLLHPVNEREPACLVPGKTGTASCGALLSSPDGRSLPCCLIVIKHGIRTPQMG